MGPKITVDCATMFNKGLEVLEAAWLFDLSPERIDVVIHRQSVVHSLVECCDGALLAQLGAPDMRLPIQYALTWPARLPCPGARLNLAQWGKLTFEPPDDEAFPAIALCRKAFAMGGLAGAVLNAANEEANAQFRAGRIGFCEIANLAAAALANTPAGAANTLEEIFAADQFAREWVLSQI
jgi:1-deoxy-D-xylulose-5-phosphate reductoisomerase